MATHDVDELNVYYSEDGTGGSYAALSEATGLAFTSDIDDETTVKTFGGGRHVRGGDDVDTYEISALFDAAAQKVFRDAKRDGTTIFLILAWDSDISPAAVADATMRGQRQEVRINSYEWEGEADGDFARFSFTATGEGTLDEVSKLPV